MGKPHSAFTAAGTVDKRVIYMALSYVGLFSNRRGDSPKAEKL